MSEFIDAANGPLGDGTFDCIRVPPSASAASVFPALSPTRGSVLGEVAMEVVAVDPAHAIAVTSRHAAERRATVDLDELVMGCVAVEDWALYKVLSVAARRIASRVRS